MGVFRSAGWIKRIMVLRVFSLMVAIQLTAVHALKCGWPGKPLGGMTVGNGIPTPPIGTNPISGGWSPTYRVLAYEQQFEPGEIVTYQCQSDQLDVLRTGYYVNRTCQTDGTWTGTRPYCDINVAFRKPTTYVSESDGQRSTPLLTDGMADTQDPLNTAECVTLGSQNAFFAVDLGQNYIVRNVNIFCKDEGLVANLVNKKLTVGNSINCAETSGGNKSSMVFKCLDETANFNPSAPQSNSVRFEHGSTFPVSVCEVTVYVNPMLSDCGEPEIPANGEVTITTQSTYQEANYTCRYGYELRGQQTRTCYGRSWNGNQPTCVESLTTTTPWYNHSTDGNLGGDNNVDTAGLDTFQIVLIVVCVALAIGLIIALIVLLKFGKLTCCGAGSTSSSGSPSLKQRLSGSGKKKKSPDSYQYQEVQTSTSTRPSDQDDTNKKRATAMAAAEEERRRAAEEENFNTRLAYQNESRQLAAAPPSYDRDRPNPSPVQKQPAQPLTYAELAHEPRTKGAESPLTPVPLSPVYAEVVHSKRDNKYRPPQNDDSSLASDSFVLGSDYSAEQAGYQPTRKSYIPLAIRKESPEVQAKQQALNDQLKDAVRVNRVTDF